MSGYEIGYGTPPTGTRFVKGKSGNPRGRARGTKNLTTILQKALDEKVTVTQNGRRRKISKLEAAVTQLVNKAASGDARALAQMLLQAQALEARHEVSPAGMFGEADERVMESLLRRMRPQELSQLQPPGGIGHDP